MDGMTKSTLWHYWVKGEGNNELMDDIESSDKEWEEFDYITRKRCCCANKLRKEVPTTDSRTDIEPLEKADQNAEECDDECVALANLIENLTLDTEEKKRF
ncbi:hypothetical protein Tco_0251870 [Tanacetum coccineum]